MQPMQLAIASALEGVQKDEGGPFGACVVKDNKVIAVAHNTVLKDQDPTCHAEMNAVRLACQKLGTHILAGCEVYTLCEPCPMCLGALYWARVDKIHISVSRDIAAKYGFDDAKFYEQLTVDIDKREIATTIGMLEKESEAVFMQWKNLGRSLY